MDLEWTWCRLDDLGVRGLYEVLALRCRVFVVGQGAYQDPDGIDEFAWHLVGRVPARGGAATVGGEQVPASTLVAYLRAVDPGHKFAEPSIGRVLTVPEVRGHGVGHALLAEGLARCASAWPGRAVRISAQAHLVGFYRRWGFAAVGAPYLEDGIPHVEMLCAEPGAKAPAAAAAAAAAAAGVGADVAHAAHSPVPVPVQGETRP